MTLFNTRFRLPARTDTLRDGASCGARPDDRGPIGGGTGYAALAETAAEVAHTLDNLLAALEKAASGDVIMLDGNAMLDCTQRVHIDGLVIEIPEGVTLASDRGREGSPGAFNTSPLIRALGEGVRITGLRLEGPNPDPCLEHHGRSFGSPPHRAGGLGRDYYYKFPVADGIETLFSGLQVDNCELAGWSHAAINLKQGEGHHIHHNFIHHNQYMGLGYGGTHDRSQSTIERNLFHANRHSIAGTGNPGSGYEACHNLVLSHSLGHCFDMHGGRDRKDGTDIAGAFLKVHHNTFASPDRALVVRGTPERGTDLRHNWFAHSEVAIAVTAEGKVNAFSNALGFRP